MVAQLLAALLTLALLAGTLALYRLHRILDPHRPRPQRKSKSKAHILIVLGSGGHTAEMIAMLERAVLNPSTTTTSTSTTTTTTSSPDANNPALLDWTKFSRRTWIVSSGDAISASRAVSFEEKAAARFKPGTDLGTYTVHVVPRAREIHQPAWTAPLSCLRCAGKCLGLLAGGKIRGTAGEEVPDLILCNGPATATIVVATSVALRFGDFRGCNSEGKMRTVYVESWARVKRLSLSGWLLSRVVDRFLVQWPQLEGASPRAEYLGVLV